jgi:hypothetical protein
MRIEAEKWREKNKEIESESMKELIKMWIYTASTYKFFLCRPNSYDEEKTNTEKKVFESFLIALMSKQTFF